MNATRRRVITGYLNSTIESDARICHSMTIYCKDMDFNRYEQSKWRYRGQTGRYATCRNMVTLIILKIRNNADVENGQSSRHARKENADKGQCSSKLLLTASNPAGYQSSPRTQATLLYLINYTITYIYISKTPIFLYLKMLFNEFRFSVFKVK